MLVAPCALTMLGAATVAAAPTAAVFRKRRRVAVVSFLDVIDSLPVLSRSPWRSHPYLLAATQRLTQGFGKKVQDVATLRRAPAQEVDNLTSDLFPSNRTLVCGQRKSIARRI